MEIHCTFVNESTTHSPPNLSMSEALARRAYATGDAARVDVSDYIEWFYNPVRRHSTLGHVSPIAFEWTMA